MEAKDCDAGPLNFLVFLGEKVWAPDTGMPPTQPPFEDQESGPTSLW